MKDEFNTSLADSQGTAVKPLAVKDFDLEEYSEYESSLLEGCRSFMKAESGVAVYRRFRVPEVFSWGCADRKLSLELQLAALKQSMAFKADIPNFLEPWYGIGVVSSAFGIPYVWKEGQAPAVEGKFTTAREAIESRCSSVADSPEGKKALEMIEYFLEQTGGKVPMSLTDTQSPLNIASSYLMDSTAFMYEVFDHPEDLKELMDLIAEMEAEFLRKQMDLIGDALVKPGHGFASARCFEGIGFSDDNILMFSDEDYSAFGIEAMVKACRDSEGPVFHSCGNWSPRQELVRSIPGLIMADGAVGNMTDPCPNEPELLKEGFTGAGTVLHTRIVGDAELVSDYFGRLWSPGIKCIIATYCETPEDQRKAYKLIHERACWADR